MTIARYPRKVLNKHGESGLVDDPKFLVGTIHSVKGGEADVVILMPDLSSAGWQEYQEYGPKRDSIIRLFYVGMTRAKETLIIMDQPPFKKAVDFG